MSTVCHGFTHIKTEPPATPQERPADAGLSPSIITCHFISSINIKSRMVTFHTTDLKMKDLLSALTAACPKTLQPLCHNRPTWIMLLCRIGQLLKNRHGVKTLFDCVRYSRPTICFLFDLQVKISLCNMSNSVRKVEWKPFLRQGEIYTSSHIYSLSAPFFVRLRSFSITPVAQMNDGRHGMRASVYFTSSLQLKVCLSATFSFSTI